MVPKNVQYDGDGDRSLNRADFEDNSYNRLAPNRDITARLCALITESTESLFDDGAESLPNKGKDRKKKHHAADDADATAAADRNHADAVDNTDAQSFVSEVSENEFQEYQNLLMRNRQRQLAAAAATASSSSKASVANQAEYFDDDATPMPLVGDHGEDRIPLSRMGTAQRVMERVKTVRAEDSDAFSHNSGSSDLHESRTATRLGSNSKNHNNSKDASKSFESKSKPSGPEKRPSTLRRLTTRLRKIASNPGHSGGSSSSNSNAATTAGATGNAANDSSPSLTGSGHHKHPLQLHRPLSHLLRHTEPSTAAAGAN